MLKNLTLFLGLLITILISYHPAYAEIQSVEMQVDGMTCPFCVYGIEKKLKALGEVTDARSNLKTGIVDIEIKKDAALDIEKLNKAIIESGFTPGKIKIIAIGELLEYDLENKEYIVLKVTGSDQLFLLTSNSIHDNQEFLNEKTIKELEKATDDGKKEIIVSGYVHTHTAEVPPALSVDSFEIK